MKTINTIIFELFYRKKPKKPVRASAPDVFTKQYTYIKSALLALFMPRAPNSAPPRTGIRSRGQSRSRRSKATDPLRRIMRGRSSRRSSAYTRRSGGAVDTRPLGTSVNPPMHKPSRIDGQYYRTMTNVAKMTTAMKTALNVGGHGVAPRELCKALLAARRIVMTMVSLPMPAIMSEINTRNINPIPDDVVDIVSMRGARLTQENAPACATKDHLEREYMREMRALLDMLIDGLH